MSLNLGDALRKAGIDVPKPEEKKPVQSGGPGGPGAPSGSGGPGGAPRGERHPRSSRPPSSGARPQRQQREELSVPMDCVFQSYYGAGDCLRREIFIEAAERVARLFNGRESGVRPFALRTYYNQVKALDNDLRFGRATFDQAKERMYQIRRDASYQVGRRTLGPVFVDFFSKNLDLAIKDEREFRGFVEFFTSVVAYSRQRE